MVFTGLAKASGTVKCPRITWVIKQLMNLIKPLRDGMKGVVLINGETSKAFRNSSGVKQD